MHSELFKSRRRLFIPEIVQTSDMDCGPASLTCLLNGYGINASYGRLREACHTSIDGTSINVIEEMAVKLGLEAEQVMLPLEHVLFPEAGALPAIAVVRNAQNSTHFVVLWSCRGGLVQVMDPAIGRRWLTPRRLQKWLYTHAMPVPEVRWQEWANSEEFIGCLRHSLADIQRANKDLGYEPSTDVPTGLRRCVEWWRQQAPAKARTVGVA